MEKERFTLKSENYSDDSTDLHDPETALSGDELSRIDPHVASEIKKDRQLDRVLKRACDLPVVLDQKRFETRLREGLSRAQQETTVSALLSERGRGALITLRERFLYSDYSYAYRAAVLLFGIAVALPLYFSSRVTDDSSSPEITYSFNVEESSPPVPPGLPVNPDLIDSMQVAARSYEAAIPEGEQGARIEAETVRKQYAVPAQEATTLFSLPDRSYYMREQFLIVQLQRAPTVEIRLRILQELHLLYSETGNEIRKQQTEFEIIRLRRQYQR